MDQRRVVITGIGIVSAPGNNCEEFSQNLFAGKSAIKEITSVDTSTIRFKKAAEVRGFDPQEHFDDAKLMVLMRFAQFAVVAARQAVSDASVEWTEELRERTAIITGAGSGGLANLDFEYHELYALNRIRPRPLMVAKAMSNAGASHISMEFGITGPTYTITTACSSASHAIGQAFWHVRQGLVDMALTGGSETPFGFANLKAWEGMRVVSPDTCRPFCRDRSGMILGEGGAMLFLETLESARKRGAEIYAEIVGFGMSADANHLTQPLAKGASKAMKDALRDGGLEPEEIGYINAHGTATQANDVMETEAIRQVFGDQAKRLAVSSTKSMHGHTLGAAGAIEAVATVLALKNGVLPPTANFTEADPECDLDYIPNEAREVKVEAALSNSFAFGGLNATLAFKRWKN
ncbi:MAG: beta-ketoacyl-[acyl-carrier-protein] synthase family protein [Pyrinomonadaceae bacterium]